MLAQPPMEHSPDLAKQALELVARQSGTQAGVHGWLRATPIATALFAPQASEPAELFAYNEGYRQLGLDPGGAFELEPGLVDSLIAELETGLAEAHGRWSSPDPVYRRDLDIFASRLENAPGESLYMLTFIDRTYERRLQRDLRREMMSDSLTGLPNRTGFEEDIEARAEAAADDDRKRRYAIFAVDLLRFSRVNQCAGAIAGDELIITVAARLVGALRQRDVVARIGGDEFAIFAELPDDQQGLERLLARIGDVFRNPLRLSDLEIQVEAAIGVAIGDFARNNATDVIRNAQTALKRAKKTKSLQIYTPEVLNQARRRFSMETELRKALNSDSLMLSYQPIVDLEHDRVTGFEALARWRLDDGREIGPTEFIPVAEECGLIVPLGRWALESAMATLAGWDVAAGAPLPLQVSVNLSAEQVLRDDIAKLLADTLAATGLSGERITLELTESVLVGDPDRAARMMRRLKELNASLAMDDFGTGYSNLASLQRLPIDTLKIDRSFVTHMLEDRDKIAIVRAVLSLANSLGMATTAEGIETLDVAHTLGALGCKFGQGFHFAQPLAPNEALDYYLDRHPQGPGTFEVGAGKGRCAA